MRSIGCDLDTGKADGKAIVVGGGIAGLVAAIALTKQGFSTRIMDKKGDSAGTMHGHHHVTVWNNGWEAWEQLTGEEPFGLIIESFEHRDVNDELIWRVRSADLPGGPNQTRLLPLELLRSRAREHLKTIAAVGDSEREMYRRSMELNKEIKDLVEFLRCPGGDDGSTDGVLLKSDERRLIRAREQLRDTARIMLTLSNATGVNLARIKDSGDVTGLTASSQAASYISMLSIQFYEIASQINEILDLYGSSEGTLAAQRAMDVVKETTDDVWLRGRALMMLVEQFQSMTDPVVAARIARIASTNERSRRASTLSSEGAEAVQSLLGSLLGEQARGAECEAGKAPAELKCDFWMFTEQGGEISVLDTDNESYSCELLLGAGGKSDPVRKQLLDDNPSRDLKQTMFTGWTPQEKIRDQAAMSQYMPGAAFGTRMIGILSEDLWVDFAWIPEREEQPAGWFWIASMRGKKRKHGHFKLAARQFPVHIQELLLRSRPTFGSSNTSGLPLTDVRPPRRMARGAVGLIGDAAHGVTLILGQSVGLALEDAVVLERALQEELSGKELIDGNSRLEPDAPSWTTGARRDRIHRALARYSRQRAQRTSTFNFISHVLPQIAFTQHIPAPLKSALDAVTMPAATMAWGEVLMRFQRGSTR